MAHRYSYQMHKGTIPKGMFVMHSCDNRLCVNPDHLIVGTHRDNMDDMINKKRQAVGERVKSSKLTKEKVKEIRSLRKRGLMYKDIAVRFGVSAYHVKDICRFRVWKHVEG
ncbi:HNH endonuclease [Paenibacillus ehimensis]|uniref:HNH endonuclease n=1 Tax=Paenibacillus ehimensis TaxID=79264 RepID=UPI003B8A890A